MRQRLDEYEDRDQPFGVVADERIEGSVEPRWRLSPAVMTAIGAVVLGGSLWFAYVLGTHHAAAPGAGGSVPLIRADDHPDKVKPDHPGGMDVPDRDKLVFNEKPGGPASVEKLLPPAEQPVPRPSPPPAAASPAPRPSPNAVASLPPSVEPTPSIAPPPAAPHAVATAAGMRVQLGSLRSPEAARQEWARLKKGNADILGKLTAVAVRADLGERGIYYRIEAGPLSDKAAAGRLCGELKKRNLGCSIVR